MYTHSLATRRRGDAGPADLPDEEGGFYIGVWALSRSPGSPAELGWTGLQGRWFRAEIWIVPAHPAEGPGGVCAPSIVHLFFS